MECEVSIDAVVNEEVCNKAYTRMLQHVVFAKYSQKVMVLFEATKPKKVTEEEWMYQLEEGNSKDPWKVYNKSYEQFMAGRVREALQTVAKVTNRGKALEKYMDKLEAAAERPELCEPLGKDGRYPY
eukprot:TRINITY_DN1205_c0_g1_i1.p1 TRINITY_DN1205_c0_g1~~TRINITY_DN1205_c0_g1_i1.p1  ORF type:complete len:127 (+),score=64.83 TRINITY_DN1205_c0_g1_i1:3-383(+)